MAGISTDGTPFFDDPNQAHNQARPSTTSNSTTTSNVVDMDTPKPMRGGSRQLQLISLEGSLPGQRFSATSPSKERDSKELKEFWKQYMRLPLTGSGMLSSEGVTPNENASKAANTSSGAGYRRPRVASLPSAKTPIVERDKDHLNVGYSTYQNQASNVGGDEHVRRAMGMRMGDTEDLRSYEAAVMARKAPMTLNLKVRRPMKGRGGGSGKSNDEGCSGNNPLKSTLSGHCSSSSSLANAFGTSRHPASTKSSATLGRTPFGVKKEPSLSPSLSSPVDSSPSSLSGEREREQQLEEDEEEEDPSPSMARSSFKRLPSQTLGPDHSKRPFYGFDEEDRGVSGGSIAERRMRRRMRRMSEPLTINSGGGGVGGGVGAE